MNTSEMLVGLNLFTLLAVAAIAAVGLFLFLRKRGAHPMRGQPERNVGARIDVINSTDTPATTAGEADRIVEAEMKEDSRRQQSDVQRAAGDRPHA